MTTRSHTRWRVWIGALLLSVVICPAWASLTTIDTATLRTRPEGVTEFGPPRTVKLPYLWDLEFPRSGGEMLFELSVQTGKPFGNSTSAPSEATALYLPRLGNRYEISQGGVTLLRLGIGKRWANHARQAQVIVLQASAEQPAIVTLRIEADPMGRSGLGRLYAGNVNEVHKVSQRDSLGRLNVPLISAALLSLFSLTSMFLYWRTREPLYGFFLGLTLASLGRIALRLGGLPGLPPVYATALQNTMYLFYTGFVVMFMITLFERNVRWHLQRVGGLIGGLALATFIATLAGTENVYSFALLVCLGLGAGYVAVCVFDTYRAPNWERSLFVAAAVVNLMVAFRDFFMIRANLSIGSVEWQPFALVFYIFVMASIICLRLVRSTAETAALNQNLEMRVAAREQELTALYARDAALARAHAAESAVREERLRLMRDMHDGVGAKLVTMLNTLEKESRRSLSTPDTRTGEASRADLLQQVRESLDELRLTIDSLEESDGDLTTVLGHLRFRLEKRFAAAGIRFDWQVAPLPALNYLTPANVQHVQRMLLEVLTNILKHAQAKCITVVTRAETDGVVLSIADDGTGFDPSCVSRGRGLGNLQFRASALGGNVQITSPRSTSDGGTEVLIWLPLSKPDVS